MQMVYMYHQITLSNFVQTLLTKYEKYTCEHIVPIFITTKVKILRKTTTFFSLKDMFRQNFCRLQLNGKITKQVEC